MLYLVSVVFSTIYFMWMRKKLMKTIMELDDKALTPSDYCLMGMHMKFEEHDDKFISTINQLDSLKDSVDANTLEIAAINT